MKIKILLVGIISLMMSLISQAAHLEFMGIPIDGTISNFQTKLLKKGCSIGRLNKYLPTGSRLYEGIFAGKECRIIVWYNHKSKKVYKTRAIVECSSLEIAHDTFDYYKKLLTQKYIETSLSSDFIAESSDPYDFYMAIFEPPIEVGSPVLGVISLDIIDYESYPKSYGLAITYEDIVNSEENEQNALDDL